MLIEPNLMELLDKPNNLTPREKQILDIIGTGKTTKQIADDLGVSTSTVGNHRKHICKKLNLHSTAELVAFAVRNLNKTSVYGK
jgi:DNA-binding CsgD family transcriptional regulator